MSDNDLADYWYYHVSKEPIAASKQVHDQDGHLVGVTEISDQAEDAVNALLPAIEYQLDREQIDRLIGIFPTIGYAAPGLKQKTRCDRRLINPAVTRA